MVGTTSLKATDLVRKYINQKQRLYDHMFVLVRNTLRILILNYKLGIFFWTTVLHPIFVCFLGIFMNITAFFKIWLAQRYNKFDSKLIRMQDFLKFMPRMEELHEQQQERDHSSSENEPQRGLARGPKKFANHILNEDSSTSN